MTSEESLKQPDYLINVNSSASANTVRNFTDAERLDWVIFNSVSICHSRDGDFYWVEYSEEKHAIETPNTFFNARDAIDAAMIGKVFKRQ